MTGFSGAGQAPLVLWLTQESPAASSGGGALRQAGLLQRLVGHARVHLVTAGCSAPPSIAAQMSAADEVRGSSPGGPIDKAAWMALGFAGVTTPELASAAPARRALRPALRAAPPGTIVVLNHPGLAPLVRERPDLRSVLELQYAPAAQLDQEAAHASGFRRIRLARYADTTRRLERRLYPHAHRVIVPSDSDATEVLGAVPGASVAVVPNAIEPADYRATPLPETPTVVFPASLGFAPNVDGAHWLVHEVWPEVVSQVAGATLALVGRAPTAEVWALAEHPGVEVHADVPDMHAWFHRARVIAVPLRFGTGTRLKALEAMVLRRPLVGTSVGLAGLHIEPETHALVADTPGEFAQSLVRALTRSTAAMVRAADRLVREEFTWDIVGERFVREITSP